MPFRLALLLLTYCALSKCSNKIQYPELINVTQLSEKYVLSDITVFNGTDSALFEHLDVFVNNGFIERVVPTASFSTDGFEFIPLPGKYVIPGLIDAHVHISGSGAVPWENVKQNVEYNLQAYLYMGITTIYDLGGMAPQLEKIQNKIEGGEMVGPDLYHTHVPVSIDGSHPIPLGGLFIPKVMRPLVRRMIPKMNSIKDAEKIASKYKKLGVDYMKVVCDELPSNTPSMPEDWLAALIKSSHEQGLKVFAHVGSNENAMAAVRSGADVLAHGIMRGKLTDDEAKYIADKGIPIIWTRAGYEDVYVIGNGNYQPSGLDRKLVQPAILNPVTGEAGRKFSEYPVMKDFAADTRENRKYWKSNVQTFRKHGGKVMIGTDSNLPGCYAGATYMRELFLLKSDGMSNYALLSAATSGNASLFLENPDFGQVKEGFKANLVVLSHNPLLDINTIDNPYMILKSSSKIVRRI